MQRQIGALKLLLMAQALAFAPSSIPFLALGSWILIIGWFGFNVMSAQTLQGVSGLEAINSLMAVIGGTLAALLVALAGGFAVYGLVKAVPSRPSR